MYMVQKNDHIEIEETQLYVYYEHKYFQLTLCNEMKYIDMSFNPREPETSCENLDCMIQLLESVSS